MPNGHGSILGKCKQVSQTDLVVPFLGTGEQWGSDHRELDTALGAAGQPSRGTRGLPLNLSPAGTNMRPGGAGFLSLTLAAVSLKGALHPPLISDGNF